MTATITAELDHPTPISQQRLLNWVREVAELTAPTGLCGATALLTSGSD